MTTPLTPNGVRGLNQQTMERPICQIINIRNLNVNGTGQDRFRVIISDGTHYIQGMLASQLNPKVQSNELQNFNIIRVNESMGNEVKGKKLIILLDIDIIDDSPDCKIGAPVDFQTVLSGCNNSNNPPNTISAAPPMYNRTNTSNQYGNNNRDAIPSKKTGNPYSSPANRHPCSSPRGGGGGSSANVHAPIVHQGGSADAGGPRITPISQLNMYQNRFTIKGRLTVKSDIKHWSNSRGEGYLMSIELLDAGGTDIRITMFKEAVDKWQNYFEVGQVYSVTGGRLKVANQQYNTCKSQYEMTIDMNTEIVKCADSREIKLQTFDFNKIGALEQIEERSFVDIIGIVKEVGELVNLISKKSGQELTKCDVTLIDDTGVQVRLTLWGTDAKEAADKLNGDSGDHKVVAAFKRARVSDYGGKSLSGGSLFVEPDIPETEDIRRWWKSQGSRNAPVKSLSSEYGAAGKMDGFADRKTIGDIKGQHLGQDPENAKGDYLTFKAHFTFLKKDKEGGAWYTACPNKEEPCRNRVKINQTTDGNYQCDRCNGTYPNCNRKWIFSGTVGDDTANTWVSVFDEQAIQLLGVSADEMFQHYESNQAAYDSVFNKASFTEWIFRCRVKKEFVNDEERIKTQVVRMEPVNYADECRDMIKALERM